MPLVYFPQLISFVDNVSLRRRKMLPCTYQILYPVWFSNAKREYGSEGKMEDRNE